MHSDICPYDHLLCTKVISMYQEITLRQTFIKTQVNIILIISSGILSQKNPLQTYL